MSSLIPFGWEVPGIFRSRLGTRAGRQRIMKADGHLLIILHKVPSTGSSDRDHAFFWRNPGGDWTATESVSGASALHAHLEHWRKAIDELEDLMQEAPSADNYFAVLQRSSPLLRTIRNTHHALQEARDACDDRAILLARDEAGELERAVDLLHTDAKNGMEFMIARQGEEQARRAHQLVIAGYRLNLLAAMFLPLTAMGSVFSMHLSHGLETSAAPWTFWALVCAALFVGLVMVTTIVVEMNRSKREFTSRSRRRK